MGRKRRDMRGVKGGEKVEVGLPEKVMWQEQEVLLREGGAWAGDHQGVAVIGSDKVHRMTTEMSD